MKILNINKDWKFFFNTNTLEEVSTKTGEKINLPHTWNNLDGQDGGGDYFRGKCVYEKKLKISKNKDKEYYLEFRGANMVATVFVNGTKVTEHKGGFSTFRVNITENINDNENKIQVIVDNTRTDDIYPETADFTFFGGIYRDVNLLEVTKTRFDLDYFGSDGIMVTPILLEDGTANVTLKTFITNVTKDTKLIYEIHFNNDLVFSEESHATTNEFEFMIHDPKLWNGTKEPNLYELTARLVDNGQILDERIVNFGIRNFKVDKDGFYLNGKKYALHGVSRHQDRLNKGWAISKEDHKQDMELIKEIGATTIRLAHYQHDQYFYDLCDEAGMVVWAEIPYISVHLPKGDENALSQMKELVIQNYNHPSICFWGISNEITIGGESDAQYNLHVELNKLVKSLDSTRLTTMACVTMCDTHSRLLDIPDIFSYNHYFGWYMGTVDENASWLDDFRKEFPNKPIGLSEYGCEANTTLHNSDPKQGDYSEEYQAYYHENMLRIFEERPYLWSTHVWNMFDFGVDARNEGGVAGRNNKGLITYDRKIKKDSFFIYKAYWSDEPFVHICSKRYIKRNEKTTKVKVYSNQKEVSLYVNNKLVETKTGNHIFEFNVDLKHGINKIKATSGSLVDESIIKRTFRKCKKYILKEEKKDVENWFEKDGVKYEFKYPKDHFSVKDKFNSIYKDPQGEKVLLNFVAMALKTIDPNAEPAKFLKMAKRLCGNMSIERVAAFAGGKVTQEMLYQINEELNKIEKPKD